MLLYKLLILYSFIYTLFFVSSIDDVVVIFLFCYISILKSILLENIVNSHNSYLKVQVSNHNPFVAWNNWRNPIPFISFRQRTIWYFIYNFQTNRKYLDNLLLELRVIVYYNIVHSPSLRKCYAGMHIYIMEDHLTLTLNICIKPKHIHRHLNISSKLIHIITWKHSQFPIINWQQYKTRHWIFNNVW